MAGEGRWPPSKGPGPGHAPPSSSMGRGLCSLALSGPDPIATPWSPQQAVVAGACVGSPCHRAGNARTSFAPAQIGVLREETKKRTFKEIEEAIVEEKGGDGRLCVKGTPGCSKKKITKPPKTDLRGGGFDLEGWGAEGGPSGFAQFLGFLGMTGARNAVNAMGQDSYDEIPPADMLKKLAKIPKAVEEAALRGRGEGVPPVDPQKGPPVRNSDLWKWVSNIQMRRAKKAALIADNAVQEAWRQQRLARYYSHEALVAEAAALRALPKPRAEEAPTTLKPGSYPIPPEFAKFSERQKMAPGWELPPTPLLESHSDRGAVRLISSASPAFAPAPPRPLQRGPRQSRAAVEPAAFL